MKNIALALLLLAGLVMTPAFAAHAKKGCCGGEKPPCCNLGCCK